MEKKETDFLSMEWQYSEDCSSEDVIYKNITRQMHFILFVYTTIKAHIFTLKVIIFSKRTYDIEEAKKINSHMIQNNLHVYIQCVI